jgi:hypothetical protein
MRFLATACAVLTLGSCADSQGPPDVGSESRSEHESRIEREIRTTLQKEMKLSVTVQCEDPGPWRAGKTFGCVVEGAGGTTKVPVTMKADHTFDWSIRLAG